MVVYLGTTTQKWYILYIYIYIYMYNNNLQDSSVMDKYCNLFFSRSSISLSVEDQHARFIGSCYRICLTQLSGVLPRLCRQYCMDWDPFTVLDISSFHGGHFNLFVFPPGSSVNQFQSVIALILCMDGLKNISRK